MATKLRLYIDTARAISKSLGVSFPIVLVKAFLAKAFFGHGIKYFSFYGLAIAPVTSYREYMTNEQLELLQRSLNSAEGKSLANDKLTFYRKCLDYDLPTPEILARLSSNLELTDESTVPVISNGEQFLACMKASDNRSFVVKLASGSHGDGFRRFRLVNDTIVYRNEGAEHSIDPQSFLDVLFADDGVYLLQEALMPHRDLMPLMPGDGLGTVRVVTVNHKRGAKVCFACVKIPVGDNASDNFVGGRTGNLLADVNLQTGVLGGVVNHFVTTQLSGFLHFNHRHFVVSGADVPQVRM